MIKHGLIHSTPTHVITTLCIIFNNLRTLVLDEAISVAVYQQYENFMPTE